MVPSTNWMSVSLERWMLGFILILPQAIRIGRSSFIVWWALKRIELHFRNEHVAIGKRFSCK